MHKRLAAYLVKHSAALQPRQKVAHALLKAIEIRDRVHAPGTRQHTTWQAVADVLKKAHFRMPKY